MANAIVELLETYLEHARAGRIKHVALSAAGDNNYSGYAFMGAVQYEKLNHKAASIMTDRLLASVENWTLPEPDPSLDLSYACFHCGHYPNGFDFLTWMAGREMMRVKHGAPGPLKVAFWRGHKPSHFDWLKVYRPLLALMGGVEDDTALRRHDEDTIFTSKPMVDMYNEGIPLPKLTSVNPHPDLPKGVITITLREATHWPHRNSDVKAWTKFARYLQRQGEHVVFVRDTAKADEPLDDFETCPAASKDIDARMCLYENAKLNCYVSNGPSVMAWFTDKPFLCFTPPEAETSEYVPNRPSFWKAMMGVEQGSQYPWFNPSQQIIWKRETFAEIKTAYKALAL